MSSATPTGSRPVATPSFVHHRNRTDDEPHDSLSESYSSLDDTSSDDEEIVYSISDLSVISVPRTTGGSVAELSDSDDDFVLLPRSDSPHGVLSLSSGMTSLSASMIESHAVSSVALSDAVSRLQIEDSDDDSEESDLPPRPTSQATTRRRRRPRGSHTAASAQSPATVPAGTAGTSTSRTAAATSTARTTVPAINAPSSPKPRKRSRKPKQRQAAHAQSPPTSQPARARDAGVGENAARGPPPVPQSSKQTVTPGPDGISGPFYQEAAQYISTFLSTPPQKQKAKSDLTLLQALIIELGVCSASAKEDKELDGTAESFAHLTGLPRSMRAAKALLKSRVFVNVRDYLDVRHKGLSALQGIMHPSRTALVKDLRRGKGKRRVPRDFVKDSGLGVLLVACR